MINYVSLCVCIFLSNFLFWISRALHSTTYYVHSFTTHDFCFCSRSCISHRLICPKDSFREPIMNIYTPALSLIYGQVEKFKLVWSFRAFREKINNSQTSSSSHSIRKETLAIYDDDDVLRKDKKTN